MTQFDTVVRGGIVITAIDRFRCDIGIIDGVIAALGTGLSKGKREVDATDKLVLPGGIDSHVHLDQDSPETGAISANDFRSGTVSAACGGNTTVIPFVRQLKGQPLTEAVEHYHMKSDGKAAIDYAFHLIVADLTERVLEIELPRLAQSGYASVKMYMTYDSLKLSDLEMLKLLAFCRKTGAMPMVHAENSDCIKWLTDLLLKGGYTEPRYKAVAHNSIVEREAAGRAISLAEIADVPLLVVHVASHETAEVIGNAQRRGLRIFGETCPQYLFLTEKDIDREGMEGAKCICSPPPMSEANRLSLWQSVTAGVFQVVSSDHAPYRFDDPKGKLVNGPKPSFNRITNGVPGIELRMPLLFTGGVQDGRIDIHQFVAQTSTNAAKIYGLYPRKGTIAIGSDADLAIWDPDLKVTASTDILHDGMDYTPYEGIALRGWPVVTMLRGEIICENFAFVGKSNGGKFLKCDLPNRRPAEVDMATDLVRRFLPGGASTRNASTPQAPAREPA